MEQISYSEFVAERIVTPKMWVIEDSFIHAWAPGPKQVRLVAIRYPSLIKRGNVTLPQCTRRRSKAQCAKAKSSVERADTIGFHQTAYRLNSANGITFRLAAMNTMLKFPASWRTVGLCKRDGAAHPRKVGEPLGRSGPNIHQQSMCICSTRLMRCHNFTSLMPFCASA